MPPTCTAPPSATDRVPIPEKRRARDRACPVGDGVKADAAPGSLAELGVRTKHYLSCDHAGPRPRQCQRALRTVANIETAARRKGAAILDCRHTNAATTDQGGIIAGIILKHGTHAIDPQRSHRPGLRPNRHHADDVDKNTAAIQDRQASHAPIADVQGSRDPPEAAARHYYRPATDLAPDGRRVRVPDTSAVLNRQASGPVIADGQIAAIHGNGVNARIRDAEKGDVSHSQLRIGAVHHTPRAVGGVTANKQQTADHLSPIRDARRAAVQEGSGKILNIRGIALRVRHRPTEVMDTAAEGKGARSVFYQWHRDSGQPQTIRVRVDFGVTSAAKRNPVMVRLDSLKKPQKPSGVVINA